MKILGTALFSLILATSFAFADGTANTQPATQGGTVQSSQDANGVIVQKHKKKHEKTETNSGSPDGAQSGQTGGSSR